MIKLKNFGPKVKTVQEWLCFHKIGVVVDGVFGPATEEAVKIFQRDHGLPESGGVDDTTYDALIKPIRLATAPIDSNSHSIGSLTVAYAQQHLDIHPIEIGGDNRGPWVRLYLNGNEGEAWAWCAGFACFCLRSAASSLNTDLPIRLSNRCNEIAQSAIDNNCLVLGNDTASLKTLKPGCLFLERAGKNHWKHTGIVVRLGSSFFETIEGNTNDESSDLGFEACRRIREYHNMDFVRTE